MSKFCPNCGEQLVDNAKFCKSCGQNLENMNLNANPAVQRTDYVVENDHTAAIVIGYVLAILIPLFGFIVAIYLLTRNDSEKARTHGKYVIAVAAVVWFISFLILS